MVNPNNTMLMVNKGIWSRILDSFDCMLDLENLSTDRHDEIRAAQMRRQCRLWSQVLGFLSLLSLFCNRVILLDSLLCRGSDIVRFDI